MTALPLITLTGRSSSSFTRIARMFALELGVPFTFQPVFDITALDASVYANNPALKIPTLTDENGPLFGTENICREILRRSGAAPTAVIMPGDLDDRVVSNFRELTLHVMASEVTVIMSKVAKSPAPPKVMKSIENSLGYLDAHVDTMLLGLPKERVLSFVEVALFCLVRHLAFREVLDVSPWKRLEDFCARFAERDSARVTEYRFDAA